MTHGEALGVLVDNLKENRAAPVPPPLPLTINSNKQRESGQATNVAAGGLAVVNSTLPPTLLLPRILDSSALLLDRPTLPRACQESSGGLPLVSVAATLQGVSVTVEGGGGGGWGKTTTPGGGKQQQLQGGAQEEEQIRTKGSVSAQRLLLSAILHLLATLFNSHAACVPVAKELGVLGAALSAHTAHGENEAVHDAFIDVVDALVNKSEVVEAVKATAAGCATLRDIALDPDTAASLAIVEGELGDEGILLEDGTVGVAGGGGGGGSARGGGACLAVPSGGGVR